jgi:2-polyprenyl-6-methoxyphenol hydroxylase-like FAD-dependent oxidoreductase
MIGKRAVVIGAGMAGLAAAGAVAGYFEKVLVLERDVLPPSPTPRPGTPQAKHVHGLLSGGQRALAELFPGFERNLEEAGAMPLRVGLDILSERAGYDPFPRRDLGQMSYYMSRPLLEQVVRRHVEKLSNVTIRPQSRVTSIAATSAGDAIIGVVCEHLDERSEMLPTDLVIDASGRVSSTLACLKSAGWPLPEKSTIGVDISYSTAIFEIPDDASYQWKAVMTLPDAPYSKRRGVMFPLEGNRWMVTIGGMHGIKTPQDEDGFLDHLRGLRTQTIYDAVKHAKRLGDIPRYGFMASEWRHFERLAGFPRGLLPLGDAFCRFNPVYGQGMSVGAQEAVLLRELLATSVDDNDPLSTLAPRFLAGAETIIAGPWTMVGNLDFIWPETTGERPPGFEKIVTFGSALTRLAAEDPAVHKLTVEVQHLLKPLSALREPALLDRVLSLRAVA